jgi:hypothetical protein
MRRERRHDGEPRKAEVGHGAGGRTYIKGIARGHKHYADAVELVLGEQVTIVVRGEILSLSQMGADPGDRAKTLGALPVFPGVLPRAARILRI